MDLSEVPLVICPRSRRAALFQKVVFIQISLGAILYTILTLERPGKGSVKEVLDQTVNGSLFPPSELSSNQNISSVLAIYLFKSYATESKKNATRMWLNLIMISLYLRGFATSSVENSGFLVQLKLLIKRNKIVSLVLIDEYANSHLRHQLIFSLH